jgi:predicted O-linked N-acetylglucosamine transferase (SPINDLY family)
MLAKIFKIFKPQGTEESVDALILLAQSETRSGDLDKAIDHYSRAIALKPDQAEPYYKRGNLLKDRGRMQAALDSYDAAIALDSNYGVAFCNRGVVLERLGRHAAALDSYDRAVALNPGDALAHYNRATILRALDRPLEALQSYDRALALNSEFAEAYCNRGTLLMKLGRRDAALADYNRSIEIHPGSFQALFNRGVLHHKRKHAEAALADYNQAIELNPAYAEAHSYRGVLFTELRQWEAAEASLDRATSIDPNFAEAYCHRGTLFAELGRHEAALDHFAQAIALKPAYAEAFHNRANSFMLLKDYPGAIEDFDRAMALEPEFRWLLGTRRHARMHVCDWRNLESDLEALAAGVDSGLPVSPPFPLLALLDRPALHRQAAQIWVREEHPVKDALPLIPRRCAGDKIRVGYFSADFRDHPVAILVAGVIEAHDRAKFEVTAFSFGPDSQDGTRRRLERSCDTFIDVRGQSDREVALLARSMGIDIAVDLGGFTANSRTEIFALRAAPLQVNYLGYPSTMGADYMDYLVADRTVIPDGREGDYTEKIIYLPDCFIPNDSTRAVAESAVTREAHGLPRAGFVFCCFNSGYKIMPGVFDGWMRILARTEHSVLWLSQNDPTAADHLRRAATRCGIDPQRLVFAGRMPSVADHLARHRMADLFLDTRPYNAHATCIDALWSGLPVITCIGDSFAARVSASLLKAVELPELITATAEDYEELAVQLAKNPQQLAAIKQKLMLKRATMPLFDTPIYTKHLEAAYRLIVGRYQAGLTPDRIDVASIR